VIHQSADIRVDELKGVQATVRLGKRFINRNHTDYPGCLIINHILGGFFGSRLMKNIREEKGLTYGISSSIQPLKRDSFFTIGTDVNVKKIDLALAEIKNEIERLLTELISIEELTIAKNHFMGSLQLEVSNPFTSIEKIKTIYLNDLNLGFYKNLFYVIKELNSSELKEVSSKYFGATSFNVVVVF
jgi:predicted Zn-dependent peptidase